MGITIQQATTAAGVSEAELTAAIVAQAKVSLNPQTGTTYQLVLADGAGNVVVQCTNASPVTLTVPAHTDVNFPVGTVIGLRQGGAGLLTVAAAGGVTINSLGGKLALLGQYACAALEKIAADTWVLFGGIG